MLVTTIWIEVALLVPFDTLFSQVLFFNQSFSFEFLGVIHCYKHGAISVKHFLHLTTLLFC